MSGDICFIDPCWASTVTLLVEAFSVVWHNITADEVCKYSPLMAGKLAATGTVEDVEAQLRNSMRL